jgi:poly-gamma-glutamate synthesis protein (capsule biosynthesis protein)
VRGLNSGAKALGFCLLLLFAADIHGAPPVFRGTCSPVPSSVAARMRQYSWRDGCPTAIADLAYLRLSHYSYDRAVHDGELVVHKDVAAEVLAIFQYLFDRHFPIEKMRLVDSYQGNDDASMADNNTSGFNCRFVAGKLGVFSKHSQGRAIDINPRTNPMVTVDGVSPPAGARFLSRRTNATGILRAGDPAVIEFTRRGWTWGGAWASMKDYQHFEK